MGKKNVSASNEGIGGHNVLQGGAFCDVSWQIGILQGLPSEVVYRAEYLGKIIQQHKNLGKIARQFVIFLLFFTPTYTGYIEG